MRLSAGIGTPRDTKEPEEAYDMVDAEPSSLNRTALVIAQGEVWRQGGGDHSHSLILKCHLNRPVEWHRLPRSKPPEWHFPRLAHIAEVSVHGGENGGRRLHGGSVRMS